VSEERSVVHLGDTEIVDGVLVGGRQVGPWSNAAVRTGAAVVALGSVVVGAAVMVARHRSGTSRSLGLLDDVRHRR
jgi:hypothetical protein